MEFDSVALAGKGELDAVMGEALGMHAGADAGLVEQVGSALLDHAGADAAEHIVAGLALKDDVVDAVAGQQLAEQQAGRAGAADGDLGAHSVPPSLPGPPFRWRPVAGSTESA